jgi:hypothetical protein
VSALRCTVQYVVLPFVLPLVGITAPVPRWVTLALSVVALLSLVRAVRQLWRMHYPGFWRYLLLAGVVGGALLVFVATDLQGSPG